MEFTQKQDHNNIVLVEFLRNINVKITGRLMYTKGIFRNERKIMEQHSDLSIATR